METYQYKKYDSTVAYLFKEKKIELPRYGYLGNTRDSFQNAHFELTKHFPENDTNNMEYFAKNKVLTDCSRSDSDPSRRVCINHFHLKIDGQCMFQEFFDNFNKDDSNRLLFRWFKRALLNNLLNKKLFSCVSEKEQIMENEWFFEITKNKKIKIETKSQENFLLIRGFLPIEWFPCDYRYKPPFSEEPCFGYNTFSIPSEVVETYYEIDFVSKKWLFF